MGYSALTVLWWFQPNSQWIQHIYLSVLPQTSLPSRLACNIEQSPLCCPAGPCWFSMINTAVCPCPSQTTWLSLPLSSSLGNHKVITEYWAEFSVLSSRSLLVLHVKYSSVSMSIPNSLKIPFPPFQLHFNVCKSDQCWPHCSMSFLGTFSYWDKQIFSLL